RPPERSLRIALSTRSPAVGVVADRHFKDAARRAGDLLREAGHDVREASVPYSTRLGLTAVGRWLAGTDDDASQVDRAKLQPSIRTHARLGAMVKRRGWVKPEQREAWRTRLAPFFDRFDLVITPTLARPPIRAIAWGSRSWLVNVMSNIRFAPFAQAWNLAGYPAAAVPLGMHPAGTPLSVQVATPAGGEALILSVARQLEESAPWPRHAPLATT